MRIISGKFKGLAIPSPKEEIVKPTLDRIKENIFNILQFNIQNSVCLDLFAGSGALGLECISRNAIKTYFVDNNKNNIQNLNSFLNKINAQNFEIMSCDFYEALKIFEEKNIHFDLIFIDPPYDSNLAETSIQKILKFNLLSQNGIIIWEHPVEADNSKFKLKIKDSRKYGKIQIDFISW